MNKFIKKIALLKGLLFFVFLIILFHISWKVFEPWILTIPVNISLNEMLIRSLVFACSGLLKTIFCLPNTVQGDIVSLSENVRLQIQPGCSGLQQFYLVILIFLCYTGPWKHKAWFIPAGLLFIYLLNIARLTGLIIYMNYDIKHFAFVHDWLFRPIIFGGIFLLWVVWEEIFNKRYQRQKEVCRPDDRGHDHDIKS